MLTPSQ
jgi:Domain of unknown function (DUF3819)